MIFNATYIFSKQIKQTLENTEGAIKSGQSRETGIIGYTSRRQTKQKHNTICVGHHYTQTNTNNVNKAWGILLTNRTSFLYRNRKVL